MKSRSVRENQKESEVKPINCLFNNCYLKKILTRFNFEFIFIMSKLYCAGDYCAEYCRVIPACFCSLDSLCFLELL